MLDMTLSYLRGSVLKQTDNVHGDINLARSNEASKILSILLGKTSGWDMALVKATKSASKGSGDVVVDNGTNSLRITSLRRLLAEAADTTLNEDYLSLSVLWVIGLYTQKKKKSVLPRSSF